jgi:hypothetical protein
VNVPKEFALLPPIVLDRISTDWVLGPGNNLLTHYTPVGAHEALLRDSRLGTNSTPVVQ